MWCRPPCAVDTEDETSVRFSQNDGSYSTWVSHVVGRSTDTCRQSISCFRQDKLWNSVLAWLATEDFCISAMTLQYHLSHSIVNNTRPISRTCSISTSSVCRASVNPRDWKLFSDLFFFISRLLRCNCFFLTAVGTLHTWSRNQISQL